MIVTDAAMPVEPSRARSTRRVLLISYHFPPVGGAGVQRPVKFVKYLRRFGWDASVLMADNPSVPVYDESLVGDIPHGVVIERARTWEPGYGLKKNLEPKAPREGSSFAANAARYGLRVARELAAVILQPDPQILWVPAAFKAGLRLLERTPHHAILATAPPYSNFILGAMLKERTGLPLLLDYRDEWDLNATYLENQSRSRIALAVQGEMQSRVLRRADAMIATTKASAARLSSRARAAGSGAEVSCIYNGYDKDDFTRALAAPGVKRAEQRRFRVVYTGTLWNLTSVAPLVTAIERIAEQSPSVLEGLELVFVGRKTREQQEILERVRRSRCNLHLEDYCDHEQALAWMGAADALCLLLSDVAGADRVTPAKLFEYMAARKEILAVLPSGEAADLLREHRAGVHLLPGDVEGIARWLVERAVGGCIPASRLPAPASIERFSRERLCGQLAKILDGLTPPR